MLGFTADYSGGSMHIEAFEIEDARWFTADHLPVLPSRRTIARLLIEQFLRQRHHNS